MPAHQGTDFDEDFDTIFVDREVSVENLTNSERESGNKQLWGAVRTRPSICDASCKATAFETWNNRRWAQAAVISCIQDVVHCMSDTVLHVALQRFA
jgi:hypothetical protein